ncbi:MAG: type II toxin-antitoxin system Phd/YefM family antitoxin [Armatimonadota bacterium]
MVEVSVEKAQSELSALIDRLAGGEEIIITRDAQPVAELVPPRGNRPRPVFGNCRGKLTILTEDDEHLSDFAEYTG